ncbi:hypothetical protein [Streptomyces sp. NPDC003395]
MTLAQWAWHAISGDGVKKGKGNERAARDEVEKRSKERTERIAEMRRKKDQLTAEIDELQRHKSRRELFAKFEIAVGVFIGIMGVYFGMHFLHSVGVSIVLAFYGLLVILAGVHTLSIQTATIKIQAKEDEKELLEHWEKSPSVRAYKLFKQHQVELKRYYDQSLTHGSILFFIGIACIFMGFSIVGATLYLISKNIDIELSTKIVIGAVGAVGAVLSDFVAAIFLKMFTTTAKSLTLQHSRLISIHFLHFGNFLTESLSPGSAELRDDTLSEMAKSLAKSIEIFEGSGEDESANTENQVEPSGKKTKS